MAENFVDELVVVVVMTPAVVVAPVADAVDAYTVVHCADGNNHQNVRVHVV